MTDYSPEVIHTCSAHRAGMSIGSNRILHMSCASHSHIRDGEICDTNTVNVEHYKHKKYNKLGNILLTVLFILYRI